MTSMWGWLHVVLLGSGVDISEEQIKELEAHVFDIDYDAAEKKEVETRHDVMAHVYTYGEVAPKVSLYSPSQRWDM